MRRVRRPGFLPAFCLNHLLVKRVWRPHWQARYLECFDTLAESYLARVTWEPRAGVEARASHLLPGLLLGRVDGKSPVEYVTIEEERNRVRQVARGLLAGAGRRTGRSPRRVACGFGPD